MLARAKRQGRCEVTDLTETVKTWMAKSGKTEVECAKIIIEFLSLKAQVTGKEQRLILKEMTDMKSTGLLMSTWSMQAYLDKRKTQTRRTQGLKEVNEAPDEWELIKLDSTIGHADFVHSYVQNGNIVSNIFRINSPYGGLGDELWFRENWATNSEYDNEKLSVAVLHQESRTWYLADGKKPDWAGKTRPGLFMPYWICRIEVPITGLRCERVQSITEADCKAEGIPQYNIALGCLSNNPRDPRWTYIKRWNTINGKKHPWSKNEWVWVLEFPRYEKG